MDILKQFTIDPRSSEAIFQQIVSKVESLILTGALAEGAFLPSIRMVALACAVNPNTIAKAYGILQSKGLVAAVRGTGLQVAAQDRKALRIERLEKLKCLASNYVREASTLGFAADEVMSAVSQAMRDGLSSNQ